MSLISPNIEVALLTGGADKPYAFGLATGLISKGVELEVVGGDELDCPEFRGRPGVSFLNLRGSQRTDVPFVTKASRVLSYYTKLIRYATTAKSRVFHILWNNKFESFDRTLLLLYYKMLGKKIVFTAHNVNAGVRDSNDTLLNRLTLRIQYALTDHIFVHTASMKRELIQGFGTAARRITVIPFGINNAVPNTKLNASQAKQRLRMSQGQKVILFFGNIAPYKGLEDLIQAFRMISTRGEYRLIIAGRPKNCERYWQGIQETIHRKEFTGRILLKADFVPDEETELYFKAADVLVLPYRHVYQSGVLFLGQSFGLPTIATDIGSLKEDIVEGQNGFVCRPADPADLAAAIDRYFASELFANLNLRRDGIRHLATQRHSWDKVSEATMGVYANVLGIP